LSGDLRTNREESLITLTPVGHTTLNCFAASSVKKAVAEKNYVFYWVRDGQNISKIPERTEHEEPMWEPPGMALKLGLIEVS
jgi:hypothetical protein